MKNVSEARKTALPDTRDAVETAIESAKKDKTMTWEHAASLSRIKQWNAKDSEKQVSPRTTKN